jgi:hypothetical protein
VRDPDRDPVGPSRVLRKARVPGTDGAARCEIRSASAARAIAELTSMDEFVSTTDACCGFPNQTTIQ